jgi:hypothetical protein
LSEIKQTDSNLTGNIFCQYNETVISLIEFGNRPKSEVLGAAKVNVKNTLLPEAVKNGELEIARRFRVFNDVVSSHKHNFRDAVSVDRLMVSPDYAKPVRHYHELVVTRELCCSHENEIISTIGPAPVGVGSIVSSQVGGDPVVVQDIPISYGVSDTNSGTLRLQGAPPLDPSYLSTAQKGYEEGSQNVIIHYLCAAKQATQRKLGGIPNAVLSTLSSVWGGYEKIPESKLAAVQGRPLIEALKVASTKGAPSATRPEKPPSSEISKLRDEISNLAKLVGKGSGGSQKSKSSKTDSKHLFKHKDKKVRAKVVSSYGTESYKEMLSMIKQSIGTGKYDVVKVSEFFKGGSFIRKKGSKKRAHTMKLN